MVALSQQIDSDIIKEQIGFIWTYVTHTHDIPYRKHQERIGYEERQDSLSREVFKSICIDEHAKMIYAINENSQLI